MTAKPTNRAVHQDARLRALRDEWIAAENAATEAWERLKQANKASPEWRDYNAASGRKKAAQERYGRALQGGATTETCAHDSPLPSE